MTIIAENYKTQNLLSVVKGSNNGNTILLLIYNRTIRTSKSQSVKYAYAILVMLSSKYIDE
jgi:hypothetical protein